jgi:enterochelin esterase-like enzyme
VTGANAQGFYDFLTQVNIAPQEERQALVDSFMNDLPGGTAPITEDTLAHFVYSGPGTSMAIAGDMTYWNPDLVMINVGSTDFWYHTFSCPRDARLDYKFVRNGTEWILDPMNPHTIPGGYGPNSELAMPDYVQPPEVEDHGYPPCDITTFADFYSPELNNTRTIKVVTPPGYDPGGSYAALIVHDGLEYITLASIHHIIAYMPVHYPAISPPICVCVPPVNRTEEYQTTQQEAFGRFIVETVIPFVNQNFATVPDDPAQWGSMGASNGGNISLYLAGTYPEHFHGLILMSPYIPQEQLDLIAAQPRETYRIYLSWGSYDIPLLIPLIETFTTMLADSGVNHYKMQFNEGHSWGLWRATVDEGFQFLYGGGVGIEDEDEPPKPCSERLGLLPYPNPFRESVTVEIRGTRGPVNVSVYDIAGHAHAKTRLRAGAYVWQWNPQNLPAARYIICVTDGGESMVTTPVLRLK